MTSGAGQSTKAARLRAGWDRARSKCAAVWAAPPRRFEWCWWLVAWLTLGAALAAIVPMSLLPTTASSKSLIEAFLQAQAAFIARALVVIVFLLEAVRSGHRSVWREWGRSRKRRPFQ